MRKRWKLLAIALFFVTVLAAMPSDVHATYVAKYDYDEWEDEDSIGVFIEYADYLDYDGDGNEDDIITTFVILPPTDDDFNKWRGIVCVECLIIMPSGNGFYCYFTIDIEDGVRISLAWINCAQESGWYYFEVWGTPLGSNAPDSGGNCCWFDPPKGDPAPPAVEIADIEEL
jgi:hypothetical protein